MLESLVAAFRILANTPVIPPIVDKDTTVIELDTYTVDPMRVSVSLNFSFGLYGCAFTLLACLLSDFLFYFGLMGMLVNIASPRPNAPDSFHAGSGRKSGTVGPYTSFGITTTTFGASFISLLLLG